MKTPEHNETQKTGTNRTEPGIRPAVKYLVGIGSLFCVAILAVHLIRNSPTQPDNSGQIKAAFQAQPGETKIEPNRPPKQQLARPNFPQSASVFQTELPPDILHLLESVAVINEPGHVLTDKEVAAWKRYLEYLIQKGDAGIPAINEYLAKNTDIVFKPGDRSALGFSSVRAAMLDVLMEIKSDTAIAALDTVLQNTIRPQEVAQVTQFMEKTEPGIFLQHSFDAVQRVLADAANGSSADPDVAPLFQVLLQYDPGNAYTLEIIKNNADQWNYYASTALARLPDQAGMPALIQIATGETGSSDSTRTTALGVLAGMASQSSDAQNVLLNLARQNNLSGYDWQILVPYLAGYQIIYQSSDLPEYALNSVSPNDLKKTMVSSSNQSFYLAPLGALTQGQISDQIDFINQMLNAASDPDAVKALQQAKGMLESRQTLLASSNSTNP